MEDRPEEVSRSRAQWPGGRRLEYANGPGGSTLMLPSGLVVNPEASVSWRSPRPSGRVAKTWLPNGLAWSGSQLGSKMTAFVTGPWPLLRSKHAVDDRKLDREDLAHYRTCR